MEFKWDNEECKGLRIAVTDFGFDSREGMTPEEQRVETAEDRKKRLTDYFGSGCEIPHDAHYSITEALKWLDRVGDAHSDLSKFKAILNVMTGILSDHQSEISTVIHCDTGNCQHYTCAGGFEALKEFEDNLYR